MVTPDRADEVVPGGPTRKVLARCDRCAIELGFWHGSRGARPMLYFRNLMALYPDVVEDALSEAARLGVRTVYTEAVPSPQAALLLAAGFAVQDELLVFSRRIGFLSRLPKPKHVNLSINTSIAKTTDYPELAALDARAFDEFWALGPQGIDEAVRATESACVLVSRYVAHDLDLPITRNQPGLGRVRLYSSLSSGKAVGYAIVGFHRRVAYLQRLAVDPSLVGMGIGRNLAIAAIKKARRHLASVMWVNTPIWNIRAASLYRSIGFAKHPSSLFVLKKELPRSGPFSAQPGTIDDP